MEHVAIVQAPVVEAPVLQALLVEMPDIPAMAAAPEPDAQVVALRLVTATPAMAPIIASQLAAEMTAADGATLDEDFAALSDLLTAAPAPEPVAAADWMQAMLRLAAAEMKRSYEETSDAAPSVAA